MGFFPMQMNNAWGVCAFLRGMIHAAGRARSQAETAGRRVSRSWPRGKRLCAPRAQRPEKANAMRRNGNGPRETNASGRHDAAGSGERYSYVCWSMSTRDKADRSRAQPRPCS